MTEEDPKKDESNKSEFEFSDDQKDEAAKEVTYRLAMMSYEMEAARYDSLLSATSHLMSFVSIESIALLTLLPTLLSIPSYSSAHVAICYLTVFGLLLATAAVALVARYRFSYMELDSPLNLADNIYSHVGDFKSAAEAAHFFSKSIEDSYVSIRKRNQRLSLLVKIATVLSLLNIVAIVVSIATFMGVSIYNSPVPASCHSPQCQYQM